MGGSTSNSGRLLCFAPLPVTAPVLDSPATTLLSPQQLQHQRGNGWSSGDYFGPPRQPRLQPQPYGGSYTPGLQHNLRYRQGSCAMYVNC
jgi:hypothetical protein